MYKEKQEEKKEVQDQINNNMNVSIQGKQYFADALNTAFHDIRISYNSDKFSATEPTVYTRGNQGHTGLEQDRYLGDMIQQKQKQLKSTICETVQSENDDSKSECKTASQQNVIQGMFSFQMKEEEDGFYIVDFKYVRENTYKTLAGTRTGKHATADGIRHLFFDSESMIRLEDFWKRLKDIMYAFLWRFSMQYIDDVEDERYAEIAATCIYNKKMINELLKEMEPLAQKCIAGKNYNAAFLFQNKGLQLFRIFEEYYASSPLINLNTGGNEHGSGEGSNIAKAKEAMQGGNLADYIEATNGLFDASAVELIQACNDLGEIQIYLPWLSDDILEHIYVSDDENAFEHLKVLLVNAMMGDHGKIVSAIWGNPQLSWQYFYDALKQHIEE